MNYINIKWRGPKLGFLPQLKCKEKEDMDRGRNDKKLLRNISSNYKWKDVIKILIQTNCQKGQENQEI